MVVVNFFDPTEHLTVERWSEIANNGTRSIFSSSLRRKNLYDNLFCVQVSACRDRHPRVLKFPLPFLNSLLSELLTIMMVHHHTS